MEIRLSRYEKKGHNAHLFVGQPVRRSGNVGGNVRHGAKGTKTQDSHFLNFSFFIFP